MGKIRVLFVCVHNSARSQMAEAFLKQLASDKFEVESAGFEPGVINPLVIEAMNEIGIDISHNQTKSVFDFFKQGRLYHFVISVCNAASAERCPIFPGVTKRLGWSFEDPASFTGSHDEILTRTRLVRDSIKAEINTFIKKYQEINF